MASATIYLHAREDDTPSCEVRSPYNGLRWIVIRLGDDLTVYLPGDNDACARYARAFAAALIAAADEIDAAIAAGSLPADDTRYPQ